MEQGVVFKRTSEVAEYVLSVVIEGTHIQDLTMLASMQTPLVGRD